MSVMTSPTALVEPPASTQLYTACYDRHDARCVLDKLSLLADAPRVAAALDLDAPDVVQLYVWFRRPTSAVALLLLGYAEFQRIWPREVATGPLWATGQALRRLLGAGSFVKHEDTL
jgi:hypothetical protein